MAKKNDNKGETNNNAINNIKEKITMKTETTSATETETEEFVIESGIELPGKLSGKTPKYPFDKLEIGQSFFVKDGEAKKLNSLVAAYNAKYSEATSETKKNRKGEDVPKMKQTRKFISRTVEGGIRVWRVSLD